MEPTTRPNISTGSLRSPEYTPKVGVTAGGKTNVQLVKSDDAGAGKSILFIAGMVLVIWGAATLAEKKWGDVLP